MIGSKEREGQQGEERHKREVFEKQKREGRRPLILRGLTAEEKYFGLDH